MESSPVSQENTVLNSLQEFFGSQFLQQQSLEAALRVLGVYLM